MIKILLVDDHVILRQGIENLLKTIPDFNIIGSVASGEDAINFCAEKKPDVILMDIMMNGMTGLETAHWIKDKSPEIKIIILSSEVSENLIRKSMKCKANGYIPKSEDKETMIEAIRTVMDNKPYFSKQITDIIFQSYLNDQTAPVKPQKNTELTKREVEILEKIANGCTNQTIAEHLFISIKTVESHKANILSKLNLKNTAELVLYAVKNGIVEP
jgi:DNA-binding NarL/FixJ family response regulator